jgi:hypothetical protein
MTSLAVAAASWQNFYILVGGVAATLIGLMFVAVTFGASLVTAESVESSRAFLDPTLAHFVQVLVTACLMLIPVMDSTSFGVLLMAMGGLRAVSLSRVHRHMRAAHAKFNDVELSDWISAIVVPLLAHVALVGAGCAFLAGRTPLLAVAVVTLVILLNGVYGAWELMIWLAVTQVRKK